MERVAIAVWNNRISPVFDVSKTIEVLDIENKVVTKQIIETIINDNPMRKLMRLRGLRVQTLICGAISRELANILTIGGIRTIPFISGDKKKVLAAYMTGVLPHPDFSMPGRICRHRWCHQEEPSDENSYHAKTSQEKNTIGVTPNKKEDKTMPNRDGTGPRNQKSQSGLGPKRGQGRKQQGFGAKKSRQQRQSTSVQRGGRRSQNTGQRTGRQ